VTRNRAPPDIDQFEDVLLRTDINAPPVTFENIYQQKSHPETSASFDPIWSFDTIWMAPESSLSREKKRRQL
jgi:hypothetical protein